mmetsp:Transcript_16666/g.46586  ORF Transcript_16666/g.46586 Transcript_16666/m.46586 type:complete len:584 (+) Transcript_16666:550-2301(+)
MICVLRHVARSTFLRHQQMASLALSSAPAGKQRHGPAAATHGPLSCSLKGGVFLNPGRDLSKKGQYSSGSMRAVLKRVASLLKSSSSGDSSEVVISNKPLDAAEPGPDQSKPQAHLNPQEIARRLRQADIFEPVKWAAEPEPKPSSAAEPEPSSVAASTNANVSAATLSSPEAVVLGDEQHQLAAARKEDAGGKEEGEGEGEEVECLTGEALGVFIPPEPCNFLAHSLPTGWQSELELAVAELDQLLEEQIFRSIPLDTRDLEEQILHHWLVDHRKELFPGHPFLLAYEWLSGNNTMRFQGDVLLWNGSTEILAVELKITQDSESQDHIVSNLRRRKVESQAAKTEVFAMHFLAQRPQLLPVRLALMVTGQLPAVLGVPVTNHFIQEHSPHLSERARLELQNSFVKFRSQAFVVSPAARRRASTFDGLSSSSGSSSADEATCTLPSLDPGQPSEPSYDVDESDEDEAAAFTTGQQTKFPTPTNQTEMCMAIVYALSKEPNHSMKVSRLANVLFYMFDKRNFLDVSSTFLDGARLGEFLSTQYRLFLSTRKNEDLVLSLPTQLSRKMSKQDLTIRDIMPYIREV